VRAGLLLVENRESSCALNGISVHEREGIGAVPQAERVGWGKKEGANSSNTVDLSPGEGFGVGIKGEKGEKTCPIRSDWVVWNRGEEKDSYKGEFFQLGGGVLQGKEGSPTKKTKKKKKQMVFVVTPKQIKKANSERGNKGELKKEGYSIRNPSKREKKKKKKKKATSPLQKK